MAAKGDIILAVLVTGSVAIFGVLMLMALFSSFSDNDFDLSAGIGKKIGIIDVHGTITSSQDIVRQLKKYADTKKIPAVVLHIDSPGGAVVPSLEIYDEILKVKEKGLVVIASFGSVAASGGYLIACACDTIVASTGSITGSIGTALSYPVANKLLDKIGLDFEVIKSGKYKDVGSFSRPATPEDRQMLQSLIDDSYRQFAEIVSESRGIPILEVINLGQGQIYTGAQAKELGLVDELGNYYDAIDIAAEMVGIEGEPKTIKESARRKGTIWDMIFEGLTYLKDIGTDENHGPRLEYIMR
jgi:protease-4